MKHWHLDDLSGWLFSQQLVKYSYLPVDFHSGVEQYLSVLCHFLKYHDSFQFEQPVYQKMILSVFIEYKVFFLFHGTKNYSTRVQQRRLKKIKVYY